MGLSYGYESTGSLRISKTWISAWGKVRLTSGFGLVDGCSIMFIDKPCRRGKLLIGGVLMHFLGCPAYMLMVGTECGWGPSRFSLAEKPESCLVITIERGLLNVASC